MEGSHILLLDLIYLTLLIKFELLYFMVYSFLKSIFILTLLTVSTFYTSSRAIASLSEHFNGSFSSPDVWLVSNSNPGVSFKSDSINLEANSLRTFPYIRTAYPIIHTDDDTVEFTFKYDSLSVNFGTGLAVTDINPPVGDTLLYPSLFAKYTMFYVWQSANTPYLHIVTFLCPSYEHDCVEGSPLRIYQTLAPDYQSHVVRLHREESTYSLYLDDVLIFSSLPTTRVATDFWFGNPERTNSNGGWSSFSIDYLKVYDSRHEIFPYLSQLDPLWGDHEYDSVAGWAGVDNSGIERWGCALTSATMVLQKYGVKSTADRLIDPGELNSWLKSHNDGYVGMGLLNWIAVSRYVREQHALGLSPTKLEFERSYLPTTPILPSIFDLGGHFVVAHDTQDLNWLINDPNNEGRTSLAMTTPLKSINRFVPSETDLSYMLFTLSPSASGTLRDENGDLITLNWIEEFIEAHGSMSQTPALKVAMLPKPLDGKYYLQVNQPDSAPRGELNVYLYDEQASETDPETFELDSRVIDIEIDYKRAVLAERSSRIVDLSPPSTVTGGQPHDAHLATNNFDFTWDPATDNSEGAVSYEFQSSLDATQVSGVLTTNLWKSQVLESNLIRSSGAPDGKWYWQVRAIDSSGNKSAWSEIWNVTLDHGRPTADLRFPTPSVTSSYFEVSFSERVDPIEATDSANYFLTNWPGAGGSGDLSGHAVVSYDHQTKTARVSFTNPGWYISSEQMWGVQNIHDLAGNLLNPNPTTEYSTAMIPPTLPAPPTTNFLTNSMTQVWSWLEGSDVGSGVAGYSARTYDTQNLRYLNDWLWLGNVLRTTTNLSEGMWSLELKARDRAGNDSLSIMSKTLAVDLTAPVSPILLSPANNGVVKGDTLVNDWTDSPGASNYIYESYHDSEMKTLRFRQEYSVSQKSATQVGDGEIWWRVKARDLAGNESEWSPLFKVTIDNTKPLIFLNAWGSTIDGTASDKVSGVNRVEIKIAKPSQNEIAVQARGTTNWSYTLSEAPLGPYRITVVAYDNAGNVSEEIVKSFVMSPVAHQTGSPTIAGATTKSEPKPPVAKNIANDGRKSIKAKTEQSPKPNSLASLAPAGAVLGESTDMSGDPNHWWLIAGLLATGSLIFVVIFSLARKI